MSSKTAIGSAIVATVLGLLASADAVAAIELPTPGTQFGGSRDLPPRVVQALRAARPHPADVHSAASSPNAFVGGGTMSAAAVTFARGYGGAHEDTGFLAKATADGGFILAGDTESFGAGGQDFWLVKLDSSGGIVWQKTFGTTGGDVGELEQTSDGGFILGLWISAAGGGGSPFTLVKLTEAGAISWQKTYGTADDTFSSVMAITGGYLLEGTKLDFQALESRHNILRLDTNGNIVWQKRYTSAKSHTGIAQQLTDGSFIVSGTASSIDTGDSDLFLAKLNSSGVIQWQRTYGGEGSDFGIYAVPAADNGFLVVGMTQSFGVNAGSDQNFDAWLLKLDPSGNVQWTNAYGGANDEFATVQAADGGYTLAGITDSFGAGNDDMFMAKLNSAGGLLWGKTYGGANDELGAIGSDSSGGGYLLQGSTDSFGAGNDDFWLAKLDTSGNVTWQHTYGGASKDMGGATRLADGSLFISGDTQSWGAGDWDAWAIKLNSTGALAAAPVPGAFSAAACSIVGTPSVVPAAFSFTVTPATPTVGVDDFVESTPAYTSAAASITTGTSTATVTDLCTAQQNLGATAAADTTSGAAPLTVNFTGSAAGGTPPYTWDWDFGDESTHSTQQSPSHTYNDGGTFTVTLKVTDSAAATATDNHLRISVTGGGGTCTVSCSATVPTTGTAGQAVAFAASATALNCPTSPIYMWSFGDGGLPSTQQNSSHTYAAAGPYDWSLIVSAGTGVCMKNGAITINPAQTCTITPTPTVPTTGTVGQPVAFAGAYTASAGCQGSVIFSWAFGDSQASNDQNPSHTYAAAGTYNWGFTVIIGATTRIVNGTITISAAPAATTWWIPSAAHAPGAGTSKWRSDVGAENSSGSTANLTLLFVPYSSGANVSRTYALANNATVAWADVLVSLFGFADSASTKGTVKITSDKAIRAISRTYNQETATRTYGQEYPALVASQSITSGQTAVLLLLKKNSGFRTNVGFQNLGTASCTGTVKLYNAGGAQVGSTRTLTAATDKYIQDDDVFAKAGAGNQDLAYAIVEVTTAGGKAWFYASVVDANTGDPTTVSMQFGSPAGPYRIPSVAHAPGAGTSKWRSNIGGLNVSGSDAALTLLFTPYSSGSTVTRTYTLANNSTVEWADVLVSLFGFADSASTKGTVKITSSVPLYAFSRTYNQETATRTYGQGYPSLPAARAITSGETAVLPLIKKNSDFRTNVGFQNLGAASCTGTIKLYNAAGAQVGSTRTLTAATEKYIQDDDVFAKAGAGNQDVAYAIVEVTTAGGKAWFYASVVDANTGDPTTIPQLQ
jgi:PKD repeat protein